MADDRSKCIPCRVTFIRVVVPDSTNRKTKETKVDELARVMRVRLRVPVARQQAVPPEGRKDGRANVTSE
jgi:hypothetical protein